MPENLHLLSSRCATIRPLADVLMDNCGTVKEDLKRCGVHFGSGWGTPDALRLARSLGLPRGERPSDEPLRVITPQHDSEARPNTLSSRYGFGSFPLHTETAYWVTPARWLVLRCLNPGLERQVTTVLDFRQWTPPPRTLRLLCNEVWKVHAGRPFLASVGRIVDGVLTVRFDRDCMQPVTRAACQLQESLERVLSDLKAVEIAWHSDDLLVIDNHRCLHGRGGSARQDRERRLERILVEERS